MLQLLTLFALVLFGAAPLRAAEPVFPQGSAVGLAPPPGLVPAKGFSGFQDPATNASIVIVEMPAEAYAQIVKAMTPDALKAKGFVVEGAIADWPLQGAQARIMRGSQNAAGIGFAKWVVVAGTPNTTAMITAQVPQAASATYPPAAIEAALRSIAFRAAASLTDQLAALPFTIGDTAGLRVVRVIAGSGLYLTDGPLDIVKDASQPLVIVAASLGRAPPPDQRADFARRAIATVNQVGNLVVGAQTSDSSGGVERIQTVGTGKDAGSGESMRVVQVVRFEGDGYVRVVGLARESDGTLADRTSRLAASIRLR